MMWTWETEGESITGHPALGLPPTCALANIFYIIFYHFWFEHAQGYDLNFSPVSSFIGLATFPPSFNPLPPRPAHTANIHVLFGVHIYIYYARSHSVNEAGIMCFSSLLLLFWVMCQPWSVSLHRRHNECGSASRKEDSVQGGGADSISYVAAMKRWQYRRLMSTSIKSLLFWSEGESFPPFSLHAACLSFSNGDSLGHGGCISPLDGRAANIICQCN